MRLSIAERQLRYGSMLALRGVVTLALASSGVLLAERFFVDAVVGVASLLMVFGVAEIANAAAMRAESIRQWWFALLDGVAAAAFGVMSIALTFVSTSTALWFIGAWFVFYAAVLVAASASPRMRHDVRHTLLSAGILHAFGALIVALMPEHPRVSVLALPSIGAMYVAAFGAWQIGAGWWLRTNATASDACRMFDTTDRAGVHKLANG